MKYYHFVELAPPLPNTLFKQNQQKPLAGSNVEGAGGDGGDGMEPRIAKLESDVGHIQSDIGDIKIDVKAMRDKMDRLNDSIWSAKVWALLLYVALAAAILAWITSSAVGL